MSEGTSTETDMVEQSNQESSGGFFSNISWKVAIVSGIMGLVIGGLAAWATSNLGISFIAFIIAGGGSTYYLYQKPTATKAFGVGLYLTAGISILVPLLFYIPTILSPGDGAEGAGTFIGSVLGFFIWGALFAVVAVITFGLGYFVNKRANKQLE